MPISEKLLSLNLISGQKLMRLFDKLYQDILEVDITSGSGFISDMWDRYESGEKSLNGKVFEGLLACLFYRLEILPLFVQAKLAFVPNVDFDFVAYSKEIGPVVLSAKTSLRERYKQADLEGMMLRQVHRKSKCYLLTLEETEAAIVSSKIDRGEVLGLDAVVVVTAPSFDELLVELKNYSFYEPDPVDVICSSKIIKGS